MKKVYIMIVWLAMGSMILTMCAPATPPGPISRDTPDPSVSQLPKNLPVLNPTSSGNTSYPIPDIVIVIDNSFSVFEPQGFQTCDDYGNKMRYKIALFIFRIIEDLKQKGVISIQQHVKILFMDPVKNNHFVWNVDSSTELINRLLPKYNDQEKWKTSNDHDETKGVTNPPYHGLEDVFDELQTSKQVSANDIIFFITDGDFRTDRNSNGKSIFQPGSEADTTYNNISGGINTMSDKQFYFLQLCPERIRDSDPKNEILPKWDKLIGDRVKVYNTNPVDKNVVDPKLAQELNLKQNLILAINDILSKTNFAQESQIVRGWKFLQNINDANNPISLPPNLLQVRVGAIPFDPSLPKDKILIDREIPLPLTENVFYTPTNSCNEHHLIYLPPNDDIFTFLWWQVELPTFSFYSSNSINFYNNKSENLDLTISDQAVMKNMDDDSWNKWSQCLQMSVNLDRGEIPATFALERDSGKGETYIGVSVPNPNDGPSLEPTPMILQISWDRTDLAMPVLPTTLTAQYSQKFEPEYQNIEIGEDHFSILLKYSFHNIYADKLAGKYSKERINPYFQFLNCGIDADKFYIGSGDGGAAITLKDNGYLIKFSETPEHLNTFSHCDEMKIIWPPENDINQGWPGGYKSSRQPFQVIRCFELAWKNQQLQSVRDLIGCKP